METKFFVSVAKGDRGHDLLLHQSISCVRSIDVLNVKILVPHGWFAGIREMGLALNSVSRLWVSL